MRSRAWLFAYTEDPSAAAHYPAHDRRVLRPIVHVSLVNMNDPVWALVDSGSERTLLAPWIARAVGMDLDHAIRSIYIGIGGESVEAKLLQWTLRLHPPPGVKEESVEWEAEVGVVNYWRPPWQILLGQIGFFDRFTVTMHRQAHAVAIERYEAFDERFGTLIAGQNSNEPRFRA